MKKLNISLLALAFLAGAFVDAAQAARLGGGRSLGAQRQITAPPRQAIPPSQQQQSAAGPQTAGSNRWLAPLAGLAAGLGLGWLFAQDGFGTAMGALLMALLAGAAVFALARMGTRLRRQAQPLQYAGLGRPSAPQSPERPSYPSAPGSHRNGVPAGFDLERFLSEAKRNFLRLQEANDRRDRDLIREVTTQEMFDVLEGGLTERLQAQQTDVVTLNAALLELVTEGSVHWASVRFSGSIREKVQAAAEPFEEIWHLQKPADGSSGWLLAGIQQLN